MTNEQIKLIHVAARQVGLIDQDGDAARYRLMLSNVGGVESSKQLTNEGLEDCMALMEDMGFSMQRERQIERASFMGVKGSIRPQSTYWRDRVARRSRFANSRMVWKILELAKEQRYELAAMCRRTSEGRVDDPEQLTPREAWNLIEGFKAIMDREGYVLVVGPGARPLFLRRELGGEWYVFRWDEGVKEFNYPSPIDSDLVAEYKGMALPTADAQRYFERGRPSPVGGR